MITVFTQILILVLFAAVGFILCKARLADATQTKILSVISVYVFLPATIFRSFANNFTLEYIKGKYVLLVISLVILGVFALIFHFTVRFITRDEYRRKIYNYSLLIPNYTYMGYPLTAAIFGEEMLLNVMIFTMPLAIYIHTIGFANLTGNKISFKSVADPSLISIVLGMIVGLSGISIPGFLDSILQKAGACMAPVSMLMTGMVISQFGIKKMLSNKSTYLIVAFRLLVIPAVLSLVLNLFCSPEMVAIAVIVYCLPCGLNTIVFPRLAGRNCEDGASLAVVSNILSLITIPLCINFLI